VFGLVIKLFGLTGRDYEDAISDAVRGVAKLGSAKKLQYRPSAALLALLERRLRRWRDDSHAGHEHAGAVLRRHLGDAVTCPGIGNAPHKFWVFPILAEDPPAMIAALRKAGFDGANLPRSATVAPPEDRPDLDPATAREALAKLVILPCYPKMPAGELERQAAVVRTAAAAVRIAAPSGDDLESNAA
jgi:dTDP-4-amino-4,6-dideoxygalactose transaminase